ncbi:MAG: hypothetical protein ACQETE_10570 [Bacteroidota bacterium]
MLNEDNICIKYLMNELDPSEAMLVEKAMMEDQDLLIEIESFRATLQKVDKLPTVQPPQELSENIIQKAAERHSSATRQALEKYRLQQPKYYAAAAMLLAGVTIGTLTFDLTPHLVPGMMTEGTQTQGQASSPATISSTTAPSTSASSQGSSENAIQPWVDQNEVLYFKEQSGQEGVSFINDAMMQESLKKLKPINEPMHFQMNSNSYQLTGSPR